MASTTSPRLSLLSQYSLGLSHLYLFSLFLSSQLHFSLSSQLQFVNGMMSSLQWQRRLGAVLSDWVWGDSENSDIGDRCSRSGLENSSWVWLWLWWWVCRGKVKGNIFDMSGVACFGFCSDLGLFWSWVWYLYGRMDSVGFAVCSGDRFSRMKMAVGCRFLCIYMV